jgi:predicted CopG family antitoxin
MEESTSKPAARTGTGEKHWFDTVATISSGVIAIGTLLNFFYGRQTNFPHWLNYLLAVFLLLIIYRYSQGYIRRTIEVLSLRSFLRDQNQRLVDFLQRFTELVTLRGNDSVSDLLQKMSESKKQDLVDRDLFAYPDQFLSNILLRLSESGKNISQSEFKGVLNDLSTLIKFCSYFYFKKPFHIVGTPALTSDERKNIELARENFADFVRRFAAYYDEANAKLGSTARAHFEIPKPLSY